MCVKACSSKTRRLLVPVRYPVGGVRTHILYTYPLLMEAGYRFTFVLPDSDAARAFSTDVAHWPDVEVFHTSMKNRVRDGWNCIWILRRLLREGRFQIIHSHGLQAAVRAIIANAGFGVPHIATSQALFGPEGISGIKGHVQLWGLGEILRRLDVLITVSDDCRDDHVRHLPAIARGPCKLVTIHNGIRTDQFTRCDGDDTESLRSRLKLSSDTRLLGYLGRFMEQKGFLPLIDSLFEVVRSPDRDSFHLVAVGSGDRLVNYQRYLAQKPELNGKITFLPHTPNPTTIMRQLDVLLVPSLWEAHPLLPMEALTMGIPVLGTSCLGLREVLAGSPSTMVPPRDVSALSEALKHAIRSPWRDAAQAYVATACKRFDVNRTAVALQGLLDSLSSRKSDRG